MVRRAEITRRDFVATATVAAATGLLGLQAAGGDPPSGGPKSRVVLVRRKEVLTADGKVVPAVLAGMLDEGVRTLLAATTVSEAWRQLVRPSDVVGIKSNVWRYLPTPPELEAALRARVLAAGVREADVAVDDRGVLEHPVFRRATALLNVRPMRSHYWSGLGTCIKNYIMFVPDPPAYHANACARLGEIWRHPEVAGKTRLNLLVMLTPQFHGVGPHSFSPDLTWRYCGLIVGTDPVAVDTTGARVIQAYRAKHFGEEKPLSPPPSHIVAADREYGLGVSDPARVEVVRVGWEEGGLI
jgi:hypothetical protein